LTTVYLPCKIACITNPSKICLQNPILIPANKALIPSHGRKNWNRLPCVRFAWRLVPSDILSDLAAALTVSLGIAPTSNLNPEGKFPSMFEPIHGSAFDITGKGVANPIGSFWTGALLLDHLGEKKAAARLMSAIEAVVADKDNHCPDLGGRATTRKVTDAVIAALANPTSRPAGKSHDAVQELVTSEV
jgi:hypothetical protein